MDWAEANKIAQGIIDWLRPACERLEVAGSLRRGRQWVSDIEIVAKPKLMPFDELRPLIERVVDEGLLQEGLPSKDSKRAAFGPRYYRLQHPMPCIQVDIFVVLPPRDWGVLYCIRTGSAEFSHWIVTEALRRGMKVKDGQLFRMGIFDNTSRGTIYDESKLTKIPCPEEQNFFQALGIPYLEPSQRETPPGPPGTTPPSTAPNQPYSIMI